MVRHSVKYSQPMHELAYPCLPLQVGPTGKAVGIEHIEKLVHESRRNVEEDDATLLTSGRMKLVGELCSL